MLMRPDVVVEESELAERTIQRLEAHHFPLIELLLQRPEQPLNPSVLPRAAWIAALMANPCQREHAPKHPTGEARFVIGA